MLSPAHSSTSGSSNSSGSSNRSNSTSSSSSEEGREHNILEPRSVVDHLVNLGRALDHQFYLEDPGRADVFQLVGDFVGPNNKRRTVFFIAHGPIATARRLTRVEYTLPVGPIPATLLFGGDGRTTLPAAGPEFSTLDVPDGQTAAAVVAAAVAATAAGPIQQRLESWEAEIARVSGIRDNPAEPPARRQGASNIMRFWRDIRGQVLEVLFARIQRPEVAPPASPPPPPPSPAVTPPAAPVATSSSERRRRNTLRRNRNAAAAVRNRATRRITGDPNNGLGYERDPVTGKLTRRRQPNSDPK